MIIREEVIQLLYGSQKSKENKIGGVEYGYQNDFGGSDTADGLSDRVNPDVFLDEMAGVAENNNCPASAFVCICHSSYGIIFDDGFIKIDNWDLMVKCLTHG